MARLDVIARLAELDGILPVDKPAGVAAHDALKSVKTHFNLVKVGHGGTLDPTASGLFVLLLGDANRFSAQLMSADRAWEGVLRLGRTTDTGDVQGAVTAEADASAVSREAVDAALAEFRGDVYQRPPAFSAVKRHETAAWEVVRTDADDAREKLVHVYRLAVTAFADARLSFSLSCTYGFSPRAFARDFGALLGCGAVLESLRRVTCGRLSVADAVGFHDLLRLDGADVASRVLPVSKAVAS